MLLPALLLLSACSRPELVSVVIGPEAPGTDAVLTADVELEPERAAAELTYTWLVNDVVIDASGPELDGSRFEKGDVVSVQVEAVFPRGGPQTVGSEPVRIVDSPPEGRIALSTTGTTVPVTRPLVCAVRADAIDPDGEEVTWSFAWSVDGEPHLAPISKTRFAGDTVPAAVLAAGQVWECRATAASGELASVRAATATVRPPSVLFFLTDDQRWDTLWAMPAVEERIGARGATFTNAYVTTPVCCPTRASILAGGFYSHSTGVLTNDDPSGGFGAFDDADTIGTRLQERGYATALVGKYLNNYGVVAPYVPPGWTYFHGKVDDYMTEGSDYFSHSHGVGSSTPDAPGSGVLEHSEVYIANRQEEKSLEFLQAHPDEPFFLWVTFLAPHEPHQPLPTDADELLDYGYTGRAWLEADMSDKPTFFRSIEPRGDRPEVQGQLQSLLEVDRVIGRMIDALEARDRADDTWLIFSSDNGYLWGEHRLWGKNVPYEESIRVPLLIAGPGVPAGSTISALTAMDLDVPATIFAVAGVDRPNEGLDLTPWLLGGAGEARRGLLIEDWDIEPLWAAWLTPDWKLVTWANGEEELYDLVADPFELDSRHGDVAYATIRDDLAAQLEPVRGLAILDPGPLPSGRVGEIYRADLASWGGAPPIRWSKSGELPGGLVLDGRGWIEGTPTEAGAWVFTLTATDSSESPWNGAPQEHAVSLAIVID